jgi:hypothetical protein
LPSLNLFILVLDLSLSLLFIMLIPNFSPLFSMFHSIHFLLLCLLTHQPCIFLLLICCWTHLLRSYYMFYYIKLSLFSLFPLVKFTYDLALYILITGKWSFLSFVFHGIFSSFLKQLKHIYFHIFIS